MLAQAGFTRLASLSDKVFQFFGTQSDFDDVFLYDNILIICEYTTTSDPSNHLKGKKFIFSKIDQSPTEFVRFLRTNYQEVNDKLDAVYHDKHVVVRILYCSLNDLAQSTMLEVPEAQFLGSSQLRYFSGLCGSIRRSVRTELFAFLDIDYDRVGRRSIQPHGQALQSYAGSLLPETHSNFGDGYKVVSFYVDPGALLERAYVLRQHGWRENTDLYQRMVNRNKMAGIRNHLLDNGRVFINNIIVTLPADTELAGLDLRPLETTKVSKTTPVTLRLPQRYNCVGIIDGQHRLFAYHEGGLGDGHIANLRERQNLLATGIIFPDGLSNSERTRFEAGLFLEINSNQTRVSSDIRQDIELIVKPNSISSIARLIISRLNDRGGALAGRFQRSSFDKDRIKRPSVASYGISPLIKLSGSDSLFSIWGNPDKQSLLELSKDDLRNEYAEFCATHLEALFSAVKNNIGITEWYRAKARNKRPFLNITSVNGIISCLRLIVQSGKVADEGTYTSRLVGITAGEFENFKSSQYNDLGLNLYKRYFSNP